MICEHCEDEIEESVFTHQSFYVSDRVDEDIDIESRSRNYCSTKCLNDWKWDKYYNYLEIDTSTGIVKSGQRQSA